MTKIDRLLTYAAEGSRESPPSMPVIFPMQCSCGHIFLEKYQYHKPLTDGRIGFCWCGFCRKKTFVTDSSRQSAILGNGGDSCSDAKPPQKNYVGSTGQYYVKQPDGHNMLCNADGTRSIFDDVDE